MNPASRSQGLVANPERAFVMTLSIIVAGTCKLSKSFPNIFSCRIRQIISHYDFRSPPWKINVPTDRRLMWILHENLKLQRECQCYVSRDVKIAFHEDEIFNFRRCLVPDDAHFPCGWAFIRFKVKEKHTELFRRSTLPWRKLFRICQHRNFFATLTSETFSFGNQKANSLNLKTFPFKAVT